MPTLLKRFLILIIILICILIGIIFISFINHHIQLKKEEALFHPTGKLVEVNGNHMHVYSEGAGEETLVFMSGGGTSSPLLDFKSLYSLFSDTYKVVVIEKAGYGFSDVTTTPREIDIILSETKDALEKAEIEGPFILFPHSMSGIEALHWAQIYPNEVKGIVGLDMAIPAGYEDLKINMPILQLGSFAATIGITRWIPNISESDAMKYGTLTDEEKELSEVIFYRRTSTKNMINEVKNIKANAKKVLEAGLPSVPMLLFSSNGEGTGLDGASWIELQHDFNSKIKNSTLIELESSHYVHSIAYDYIAKESKVFINSLTDEGDVFHESKQ